MMNNTPRSNIPTSPRSPVSPSKTKKRADFKTSPDLFAKELLVGKAMIRGLMNLSFVVGQHSVVDGKERTSVPVPGMQETINKQQLIGLTSKLCLNLDKWGKQFRATAPKKASATVEGGKKSSTTSALFYIGDQLRDFLKDENYGNGFVELVAQNPALSEEQKIQWAGTNNLEQFASLYGGRQGLEQALASAGIGATPENIDIRLALNTLVFERNIINLKILLVLLSLIRHANNLSSKSNGSRVHYDAAMVKHFGPGTNTRLTFRGVDLASQFPRGSSQRSALNSETVKKLERSEVEGNQSVFEVVATHLSEPTKGQQVVQGKTRVRRNKQDVFVDNLILQENARGSDDWGMLIAADFTWTSRFRIPRGLLPQMDVDMLKSSPVAPGQPYQDEDGKTQIADEDGSDRNPVVRVAMKLAKYLNRTLDFHKALHAPEKARRQQARNKAASPKAM